MKKRSRIITPILLAGVCAIGVHMVLFTDAGHRLQSAIVESNTTSRADTYLSVENNFLSWNINISATNVTSIEADLSYNPETLYVKDLNSPLGEVQIIEEGFSRKLILSFSEPISIQKNTTILTATAEKILPDTHLININNVIFHMTDGDVGLSSEGTGTF